MSDNQPYTLDAERLAQLAYQAQRAARHYRTWRVVLYVNVAELDTLAQGAAYALANGWDGRHVTGHEDERETETEA